MRIFGITDITPSPSPPKKTQRKVTFCTAKREQAFSLDNLLQITKSHTVKTKLSLLWKVKEKREKYLFKTSADRELIYVATCFAKYPVR